MSRFSRGRHARESIPIAITGLGLVCPLGNSVPQALARALRGESAIRRYTARWVDERHLELRERVGGTVEGFDGESVLPGHAARHEPATLFALAAADEAIAHARLSEVATRERVGCVIGAGLPGAELWHQALHAAYVERRPEAIGRMAPIFITSSAVTGTLARRHRLLGPSIAVSNACASGTSAIALGADQLRLGRADAMVVGACESSMRALVTYAAFMEAGMNTTREPRGACAPFSRDRRGFVLAEGAGVLVLERLDHALARGAGVLAVLAGSAVVNDAHHPISPDPSGQAWARAMQLALDDAGLDAGGVDAVSAHATATPQGDVAETRAIRLVLGRRAEHVPVSATKSMHGHAFGAAGAIESALAIAALRQHAVLPTIDLEAPDPECDLDYVPHRARRHAVRVLLKNGFGAGGVATSLVFRADVEDALGEVAM